MTDIIKIKNKSYLSEVIKIGLPVTLQCIFQASYSFVDQLMVGTLGTDSIAGGGLGGKFSSLVTFTLSSVATVASILIAQYHGNKDNKGISRSFFSCVYLAIIVLALFAIPAIFMPKSILGIYTNEKDIIEVGAGYLSVIAISYIPMVITLMLSSLFRSLEKSKYPMYVSIIAVFSNVLFNYIFIFGKFGAPKYGLIGAAIGTLAARTIEALILIIILLSQKKKKKIEIHFIGVSDWGFYKKISLIVFPILLNEFSWSVGENIYAAIYGRLGKDALAAMTLTNPVQGMFIGMFSGLSAAAAVMVGKRLGKDENDEAYSISKYIMKIGLICSLVISIVLIILIPFYVRLFNVLPKVREITIYIIYALAAVIFAKILNMILSGGILRSGGNTHYTLVIDLIGTWIFGVPIGLLTAFVFHLPVYLVYFFLSLEEVVRLIIGIIIFKKKKWMKNIT